MIIDKIKIKNFKQYTDEKITFAYGKKNFTILNGKNGTGKTNLVNAITWCFYGTEMHLADSAEEDEGLGILNVLIANELEDGEHTKVEVKIYTKDDEGKALNFIRSRGFTKKGSKIVGDQYYNPDSINGTKFEIIREIDDDMVPVSTPNYVMDTLIPKSIEEYFFFDGERLNDYFKKNSGKKIREAVFKISQLETFLTLIDHLKTRRNYFRREFDKLSPKTKELRKKIEITEKDVGSYQKECEKLKIDQKNSEDEEEEYSLKLKNCSIKEVKRLEEERNELEIDINNLNKDINLNEKDRSNYLIKNFPKIMVYDELKYTKSLIDKTDSAGGIPPNIRKEFVEKLLTEGKCICGSDISVVNDCRDSYKKLFKTDR